MSCCGVPITEGFMDSKWDKIAKSRKEAEKKAAEKRKSEEKTKNDAEAYRISESTRASIAKFKDTASNDDASIIGEMKSFIGSHVTNSPQTNVPTMYDVSHINRAITKAKSSSKPTIIELNTIIAEGTELEGTSQIHGNPLSNVAIEN